MRALASVVAALAMLVAGCSAPGAPKGAVGGSSSNCADLFANAMASRQPVRGSWVCLDSSIQAQFRSAGLDGDEGIAKLAAKDPVYSRQKFLGRLDDGAYVYSLGGNAGSSVLLVWLNQGGKVVDVRTGGRSSG
jgi:hypothetical protein